MTAAHLAPRFVSAGEALTDFIRREDGTWLARAGGAPWNVARVMAGFGIPSAFAGSVSRDNFGDELAARFKTPRTCEGSPLTVPFAQTKA